MPEPTNTLVLPEHPPAPGDLVQVRSRRWLVEEVVEPATPGQSTTRRSSPADSGRLLPEPVSLSRAKNQLALPWLKAGQGFAKRRQEDVHLILALGGARKI